MSGYSGFKTDDYIYKPKGGFSGDFGSSNFKYDSGSSNFSDAAKGFLNAFVKGLEGRDKYREQASPSFIGVGRDSSGGGGFTGGMSGELSFVPAGGSSFGGVNIPGVEGEEGWGTKLAKVALGAGAGALTGMAGGAVGGGWLGAGGGLLGGLGGVL